MYYKYNIFILQWDIDEFIHYKYKKDYKNSEFIMSSSAVLIFIIESYILLFSKDLIYKNNILV